MKVPLLPPLLDPLMAKVNGQIFGALVQAQVGVTVKGVYLHWDDLRHREPPEGLSHEFWWMGIRLARQSVFQTLPLFDKTGRGFVFGLPEAAQIHLHHIDQDAVGTLRSASEVVTPAHRDEYVLRSLIEESITSSQLEGASTTRKVAEAMLREGRKPRTHDEQMIFNNFRTMRVIQGFREEPFTPERILEVHRWVTGETLKDPADEGRFRNSDDVQVVNSDDGTLLHQPPPYPELPERLKRLCAFANAPESDRPFVHPVLRAILLHFMIGYDHPFSDGNGRTARALFYWSMLRSGYWLTEFISISQILKQAPAQYGRAYLCTETDGGDTTYFLLHQLETIRRALDALQAFLARRKREQQGLERLLRPGSKLGSTLNHRQRALLAHALRHEEDAYTIRGHQKLHDVAYQTARTDLLALAEMGLLEQAKQGKAMVYSAPPNLKQRLANQDS